MENKDLTLVIKEANLETSTSTQLEQAFSDYFKQANDWKEKASQIKITSIDQVEEMQAAREARLALKRIRVDANKTRKLLKEESLRYGKAVQGVYNVIEYLVKPIEQYLEDQEKFAEREQARIIQELKQKRLIESLPYEDFFPTGVDLGTISDEDYIKILNFAKEQKGKHEAEQKRLEEERLLNEKLDKIERDRKYSLAPLSDFVDASKLDLRNMTQEEFNKIQDKASSDKKAYQQEQERVRVENERLKKEAEEKERRAWEEQKKREEKARKEREALEAKARKEREEKERLQKEIRRQKEEQERQERERLAQIEKEKKEKAKQEKLKRLAPDKEKLLGLADLIDSLEMPTLSNEESIKVLNNVKILLGKTSTYLRDNSNTL